MRLKLGEGQLKRHWRSSFETRDDEQSRAEQQNKYGVAFEEFEDWELIGMIDRCCPGWQLPIGSWQRLESFSSNEYT